MSLIYRIDILKALKEKGYNTNRIRKEHLLSEQTLTNIRHGKPISLISLDRICTMLKCQPNYILLHVKDE